MSPALVGLSLDALLLRMGVRDRSPFTGVHSQHCRGTGGGAAGAHLSFLTALAPQGLPLRWGFVPDALGHQERCELGVRALGACRWRGIPGRVKNPVCRWPA